MVGRGRARSGAQGHLHLLAAGGSRALEMGDIPNWLTVTALIAISTLLVCYLASGKRCKP